MINRNSTKHKVATIITLWHADHSYEDGERSLCVIFSPESRRAVRPTPVEAPLWPMEYTLWHYGWAQGRGEGEDGEM